MNLVKLASILLLQTASCDEPKLKYVFEIVRHGARAPMADDTERFTVSDTQMLTPQGMRQRYLLGKHNIEKYGEDLGVDSLFKPDGGLWIQSTDVYRTLQSGYSELMGMMSSQKKLSIPEQQVANLKKETRGTVPFKTRKAKDIKITLGQDAIIDGFINFPIYTFIQYGLDAPQWGDDLNVGSCQYVQKDADVRGQEESTYADLLHIRDDMADDIAVEFGVDPEQVRNLPFNYFSGYMDVIFAENFEGIPTKHVNWTKTEWDYVHQILNAVLLNPFSEESKQLFVTKQFDAPFADIKKLSDFET